MPYDNFQLALAPPWLQKPVGEAWMSATGLMKDAIVEAAIAGVKCRWLTVCPIDAVPFIGKERNLDQFPGENMNQYRARLLNAWTAWAAAGTKAGVLAAISGLGYSAVTLKENADWAAPVSPGYAPGAEWWRFWVIINQPHAFTVSWNWGDGTTYASKSWGFAGSPAPIQAIQAAIRKWKPAHALCVNIIIVVSGKLIGSTWAVGDGTVLGTKAIYATL
jgi:hypothetical protein